MYLDNKLAGSKLCCAAIPSLGEGLAPLENGSADDGVRQDIFHLLDRVFSTVPNHAGMQDLKSVFKIHPCVQALTPNTSRLHA